MRRRIVYPFSAIVNLEKLKLAILINAVNPKIGGLLIRGPKGSGKTTIVRALASILPKIKVVKGCPFNCNPYDLSNMCPKCLERYEKGEELPVEEREMTVVDLPLGATEDRVVGSLDVEKAIKYGIEALEPGILAEANQNILYVDEINLLPDHIADDLLDAAATGWNVVEREGISVRHPSRFIFIGTMNPEEGELRPQLLDRFPLSVTVTNIYSVEDRMEIVRRNIEFEKNPEEFLKKFEQHQEELKKRIIQAREILPKVSLPEPMLEAICKACIELKVDGVRPDIVISKAACTLAALENRTQVTLEDVLVAAELALEHRTREGGFLEPATPEEIKETFLAKVKEVQAFIEREGSRRGKSKLPKKDKVSGRSFFWVRGEASEKQQKTVERLTKFKFVKYLIKFYFFISRIFGGLFGFAKKAKRAPKGVPWTDQSVLKSDGVLKGESEKSEKVTYGKKKLKVLPVVRMVAREGIQMESGKPLLSKLKESALKKFGLKLKIKSTGKSLSRWVGRRVHSLTTLHKGRIYGWRIPKEKPRDVHLPATIRAASRKQKIRKKPANVSISILPDDVREKMRICRAPVTMVFVIDLSGSMLFNMEAVKEAILKLHRDAYRNRDLVGIVALKDTGAMVVQHPIRNLRVVANKLLNLRVSGFTPLAAGMLKAWEVLKESKRRNPSSIPVMVLVTDGCANVPLKRSLEYGEVRTFDEARIAVREFEDLAMRDVFSVAKLIKKDKIHMVVINTNPHIIGRESYGNIVTKQIATITGGFLHDVGRVFSKEEFVDKVMDQIVEDRRQIVFRSSREKAMARFD